MPGAFSIQGSIRMHADMITTTNHRLSSIITSCLTLISPLIRSNKSFGKTDSTRILKNSISAATGNNVQDISP